jgi:hypothetical protein
MTGPPKGNDIPLAAYAEQEREACTPGQFRAYVAYLLEQVVIGRSFVISEEKYIGMVNVHTQEGDLIVVLAGLNVPMALTSVEGEE